MRNLILLLMPFFVFLSFTQAEEGNIYAGQGIMAGELSESGVCIQLRLSSGTTLSEGDLPGKEGWAKFILKEEKSGVEVGSAKLVHAIEKHDHIARVQYKNLKSNTNYTCTAMIGPNKKSLEVGPTISFKTHQGELTDEPASFVVTTGFAYAKFHGDDANIDEAMRKKHLFRNKTELAKPYEGHDKHLGYPALEAILKMKPNFFVGTGDTVYYDFPNLNAATTLPTMRKKYHEQFIQPRFKDLFAEVPTYWQVDDHDYRIDNGDNTGDHEPSVELAQRVLLEQLPFGMLDDKNLKTYRTYRVNKDMQVWLLEGRFYRTPNEGPDGPEKTMWGKEQTAWLKKTLSESTATFKIMISPTPMLGPDGSWKIDNHASVGGYNYERDSFFKWIKDTELDKKGFYIVCGDRHWQYHCINPQGIEEFSCGALIDTNSRLGYLPGGADTTDPKGLLKHLYAQDPASGGFLRVAVEPKTKTKRATLRFNFHDEHGVLLHSTMRQPRPIVPE